jgi:ubiquinone/menaquinone biosynthesis C-methylase UbiE
MINRDEAYSFWEKITGSSFHPEKFENFMTLAAFGTADSEKQTNEVFSDKWGEYEHSKNKETWYQMQKDWYLKLYGFSTVDDLSNFLNSQKVIFDAGCGLGYKTAWFASLAPNSLIIGIDFSDAVRIAARNYQTVPNMLFAQGDIANTPFANDSINYVSCDQVIMHTEDPDKTFRELVRITEPQLGEFACYFYAQKALPRELLDEHFRSACKTMSREELWEMSKQLTVLGKNLSELNQSVEIPDIPALGIEGGTYDLQRFIYWNLLKCFWNEELGEETSVVTNYDWYSPSNARRYSENEIQQLIEDNSMETKYFHKEEACYSGRFAKLSVND